MTRSANDDMNDPARAVSDLVRLAQQVTGGELTPREHNNGLVRFEQAIARKTLGGRGRRAWQLGFLATAAAAAAIAVMMTVHPGSSALTFSVVGGNVSDGGYVRASGTHVTELHFSDGSNLALDPGTSSRVTDLSPNGSRVFLESGHAHVKVTPRPHAKWTVDAGPYSVRVVGTEFDIRWSASEEMFDVNLHKGSIVVTGPLASRGLTMEAGQHLVANVKQGEIFLDRAPGAGGPEAAENAESEEGLAPTGAGTAAPARLPESETPEPRPAAPAVDARSSRAPAHARPAPAVAAPAADAGATWAKRVAGGDFQGVLAEAEHRGLDSTFGTASPSELAALADAARYVRRSEIARRALLAERERFPKSREGREAAFFLGGLSEDEPGAQASKAALDWYDRYLDESPHGAYAAHALGREMVLVHKLQGAAAARPLAEKYLERFPNGPYAGPARKLTEEDK
jgi:hypothetical protein